MTTFGDPPITVDDRVYNTCVDKIRSVIGEFRTKNAEINRLVNNKTAFKEELKVLAEYFLIGKMMKRQSAFADFARTLKETFGIESPATGALWGGDGAQDQAKADLGQGGGKVLSESGLGKSAVKMSLSPQGPIRNETPSDFAERNQAALQFWGAISALYAESLTGDIHVWMPKGLTVGSIFWNDELPVLMERKRKGEDFNLIFHTNPGDWSQTVAFEDLVIGGAYVADRKGLYQGRKEMKDRLDPAKGIDANEDLKTSMTLSLSNPIKVTTVKFAMQALLDYTVMKKSNEAKDPTERINPAVLAKLALWRARARQSVQDNA